MDIVSVSIITLSLLLILILLGTHVGVALALLSVLGIWLSIGDINIAIQILGTTAFNGIREYTFGVIPLFVLMGLLINLTGAGKDLYHAFDILLRRVRGGLGMATVGSNAAFASVTGVSVASVAVFSQVALKPMTEMKYDKKFALGTIAGSSLLGMLIPPSILLIFYGMIAEISIGRMFIAGIIPGILLAVILCIGIYIIGFLKPSWIGGPPQKTKQRWTKEETKAFLNTWPIFLLMFVVLGGIYGGVFTATEAGGVGAFGALLLALFKRKLNRKNIWSTLVQTGYTSCSILFLLISAHMYSRMLSLSGVLNFLSNFFNSLNFAPIIILFIFVFVIILLGMILDSTSIMLICLPIMIPVVATLGFDLIHFGIISVVAVEMGLLTPPFGIIVFAIKSAIGDQASIEDIFKGVLPFLFMIFIFLIIIIFIPSLSTWLPSIMM